MAKKQTFNLYKGIYYYPLYNKPINILSVANNTYKNSI